MQIFPTFQESVVSVNAKLSENCTSQLFQIYIYIYTYLDPYINTHTHPTIKQAYLSLYNHSLTPLLLPGQTGNE